jgi:putative ABC transport system permease protein
VDRLLERVRTLPGVRLAGVTTNLPLQRGTTLDSVFEVEGHPPRNPADVPITAHRLVTPGYPETIGVTLVAGRLLDDRDRAGALPVAVVSEELVRQAWPGEDPIGRRIRRVRAGERGPWMSVVGVVKDVKEDRFSFRIDRPVWYLPYAQRAFPSPVSLPLELVVRAEGDGNALAAAVRAAVHEVDPAQPVAGITTMAEQLSDVLVAERFGAVLVGALAGFGLLLAVVGLYGVVAYSTSQRTGEIGIRMALGARPRDVARLVLGEGVEPVLAGLAVGLAGAWGGARLLGHVLYGVSPSDPLTFVAIPVVLLAASLLGCWLPARRAALQSPLLALRRE